MTPVGAGGWAGRMSLGGLLVVRVAWSLLIGRLAVPPGARLRVGWLAAGLAVPLVGGAPLGLWVSAGGRFVGAAGLAVLVGLWVAPAALGAGRRAGGRAVAAAVAGQAAALLLAPAGPLVGFPPLIDAGLAGIEGTLLLLLVLHAAPPVRAPVRLVR